MNTNHVSVVLVMPKTLVQRLREECEACGYEHNLSMFVCDLLAASFCNLKEFERVLSDNMGEPPLKFAASTSDNGDD